MFYFSLPDHSRFNDSIVAILILCLFLFPVLAALVTTGIFCKLNVIALEVFRLMSSHFQNLDNSSHK
jgi:hypothetical protein